MPSVVSTPLTPRHLLKQQHGKTSGSHHKRFIARFPQVNNDEALIDYYSCALVADILLQGVLYVGERHFAFYSNIFGHKKRLLIPAHNVLKVTKERTAKFIPNAVGITTAEHKFVFASLLSRDATFKAVHEVWNRCSDLDVSLLEESDIENSSPVPKKALPLYTAYQPASSETGEEEDSSRSEVGSTDTMVLQDKTACLRLLPPLLAKVQDHVEPSDITVDQSVCEPSEEDEHAVDVSSHSSKMSQTSILLITSTFLLVVLFASATVLVYRIAVVQKQLHSMASSIRTDFRLYPESTTAQRWKAYQETRHQQNQVLSEEVGRLTSRLQEHIRHLHQMQLPLQDLAATASKMPEFCPTKPVYGRRQAEQSQQPKSQLHQEEVQWAT